MNSTKMPDECTVYTVDLGNGDYLRMLTPPTECKYTTTRYIRADKSAQLTKTDDNVSCPSVANAGDINAELLEALRAVDAVICHELCSSPNKQIADSGELCRSDISKIRRFISRPVDLKELKLKEYNDFKQRVALEQEEDDDTCKRAEQKGQHHDQH